MELTIIKSDADFKAPITRDTFIDFLYAHLERFGDPKPAINKCLDYAFSADSGKGGFAVLATQSNELVGGLIMNFTGMDDFIPPNILVYVAVHGKMRGQGLGSKIIEFARKNCQGDIALHVEYDNPAKRLYERLGFASKYAEMRLPGGSK